MKAGETIFDTALFKKLWAQGVSHRGIAERTGMSTNHVAVMAKRLKVGPHPKLKRMPAEEKELITIMLERGAKPREVAKTYGFHLSSIYYLAARRRGKKQKQSHRINHLTDVPVHVPEEVLQERERRYAMPMRDLTAILLGDPPVGFSALDRSRNSEGVRTQ